MFLTVSYCILLPLLVLLVIGVQIEATTPAGTCPDGTLEAPNHSCFKFVTEFKTFSDAEHSCSSMGGHLAVVDSMFTNAFLAENAESLGSLDFWIGANVYSNLKNKPWLWTDAYKYLVYTDWANGQPSGGETGGGQCASASVLDGTWSAVDCNSNKPYVCEVSRITYNCPSEWIYYDYTKSCYNVFFWANWQNAEDYCLTQGSHLTSIHSEDENKFIYNISRDGNAQQSGTWDQLAWIGLFTTTNDNSVYQWSDGSPYDYINWALNQPDLPGEEKCGQLFYDFNSTNMDNYFNNLDCMTIMRNYVCKKPATAVNL